MNAVLENSTMVASLPKVASAPTAKDSKSKERHVLDAIALQASILLNLLDMSSRSDDLMDVHYLADAARVIGATIGSLADGVTGEDSRGDQYDWHQARAN